MKANMIKNVSTVWIATSLVAGVSQAQSLDPFAPEKTWVECITDVNQGEKPGKYHLSVKTLGKTEIQADENTDSHGNLRALPKLYGASVVLERDESQGRVLIAKTVHESIQVRTYRGLEHRVELLDTNAQSIINFFTQMSDLNEIYVKIPGLSNLDNEKLKWTCRSSSSINWSSRQVGPVIEPTPQANSPIWEIGCQGRHKTSKGIIGPDFSLDVLVDGKKRFQGSRDKSDGLVKLNNVEFRVNDLRSGVPVRIPVMIFDQVSLYDGSKGFAKPISLYNRNPNAKDAFLLSYSRDKNPLYRPEPDKVGNTMGLDVLGDVAWTCGGALTSPQGNSLDQGSSHQPGFPALEYSFKDIPPNPTCDKQAASELPIAQTIHSAGAPVFNREAYNKNKESLGMDFIVSTYVCKQTEAGMYSWVLTNPADLEREMKAAFNAYDISAFRPILALAPIRDGKTLFLKKPVVRTRTPLIVEDRQAGAHIVGVDLDLFNKDNDWNLLKSAEGIEALKGCTTCNSLLGIQDRAELKGLVIKIPVSFGVYRAKMYDVNGQPIQRNSFFNVGPTFPYTASTRSPIEFGGEGWKRIDMTLTFDGTIRTH